MSLLKIFYFLKPVIPRRLQLNIRRLIVYKKRKKYSDIWPIDKNSNNKPDNWAGWPEAKDFALVLTHDVETELGQDKCLQLMDLEKKLGFCSSFNFVPRRYDVSDSLRDELVGNGFEVGVHGLYHDGNLYKSKEIFLKRSAEINKYLKEWHSVGFRSPAMHHNLDWLKNLNILYDLSTFDTDPFEPQPDGVSTIFPFYVNNTSGHGFIEMPYTLAQDFTTFILMQEKNIDIWKEKVDWIAQNNGMVLVNVHPDYIYFENEEKRFDQFPIKYYEDLLTYIKTRYEGRYWHSLPRNIAKFCLDTFKTAENSEKETETR